MTYNNNTMNAYSNNGLGAPGAGFGGRAGHGRVNSKRLSVALPPKVAPITEDQVDNPTPRTSRSHLLAGLRTQPKTPAVPASAPFNQTQYQGFGASKWGSQGYNNYDQGMPQTATGAGFDSYSNNAARQMYSLPEQVLAPPNFYDQTEDVDPAVLQQMQMTSFYLAQRQQQLQQQLATLTSSAQGMSLNTNIQRGQYGQGQTTPQAPQNMFGQQQFQGPIEVPGQPGVYLVYNQNMGGYTYMVDPHAQQQSMSPVQQNQGYFSPPGLDPPTPSVSVTPPIEGPPMSNKRSFTPPKKAPSPPSTLESVEPLPPPSANAFRRGHSHKKTASLSINPMNNVSDGPKTTSSTVFGSQRSSIPAGPMTGTFGPGAGRSGDHPIRQPRGPPAIEELKAAPTSKDEGSKNFSSRQRRRALDSLVKAGSSRRGVSASPVSGCSPISEHAYSFPDDASVGSNGSRKMSPIGSEMREKKRGSQGSSDGYFGLSSASSSEGEDSGSWKLPPTPATPVDARMSVGGERKKMMLGVLNAANAAEKRRSVVL